MIVSVDGVELISLSPLQLQVIADSLCCDTLEDDLKERIKYILKHKYDQCFARLKKEWDIKLPENGVTAVPTGRDEYAQLVFAQPNYKDRKAKILDEQA